MMIRSSYDKESHHATGCFYDTGAILHDYHMYSRQQKNKLPLTTADNCRLSIDPEYTIGGVTLTAETATQFLVECMMHQYKQIGTIDINDGMLALNADQEKLLLDKGFKIVTLEGGDTGIASTPTALNQLIAAYKMPDGPAKDIAMRAAMNFYTLISKDQYQKEIVLKKFCKTFCP